MPTSPTSRSREEAAVARPYDLSAGRTASLSSIFVRPDDRYRGERFGVTPRSCPRLIGPVNHPPALAQRARGPHAAHAGHGALRGTLRSVSNVRGGVRYLKELLDRFDNRLGSLVAITCRQKTPPTFGGCCPTAHAGYIQRILSWTRRSRRPPASLKQPSDDIQSRRAFLKAQRDDPEWPPFRRRSHGRATIRRVSGTSSRFATFSNPGTFAPLAIWWTMKSFEGP